MQNEALIWLQKPTHVSENAFEKSRTYLRMGDKKWLGYYGRA